MAGAVWLLFSCGWGEVKYFCAGCDCIGAPWKFSRGPAQTGPTGVLKPNALQPFAAHGCRFRKRTPNFQEPLLTRNLNLVEVLREIGNAHGRTPGEVAIAWALRRPEVTGAIVGMRSPQQVDGVIGAAEFRLSGGEIETIATALAA